MNGCSTIPGNHSSWTSFQHRRSTDGTPATHPSVIDYVLASPLSSYFISKLAVSPETEWSDHAYLSWDLFVPGTEITRCPPVRRPRPHIAIPLLSDIDHLQHELLHSRNKSHHERLLKVYGHASCHPQSTPLKIFTDGSCLKNNTAAACAGLGIYVGPNHHLNLSARILGPQRNNRAELYAILATIQRTSLSRTLEIYTDSTYAIQSIVYNAPDNAQCCWNCPNGDLLQVIAQWILARASTIAFTHVHAHIGITQNEQADQLAKAGANLPLPQQHSNLDFLSLPTPPPFIPQSHTCIAKVSTTLPDPRSSVSTMARCIPATSSTVDHRGRSHRRKMEDANLSRLRLAADTGGAAFWKFYKSLRNPDKPLPKVTLEQLTSCFIPRMNPPDPHTTSFDPRSPNTKAPELRLS
ncbi:ribonuclease H-like partial [Lentinula edodes]|uniref:ribonuclease H n=1 Tax=Lentinula edodes TaxID=5353 RepID=A0A1Q3ETE6_LENED|nr:ribonuclease H-like partial [Lentinula edodes]